MAKNFIDNLGEEVKKGMREKAEQGHWPSMAPIGYTNNPATHRIEPDTIRTPLIAEIFQLYASGTYSLKSLLAKADAIGLTHPRARRRLFKSELHRLLCNPIYHGDFVWDGNYYRGSHQPLISRDLFEQVQGVIHRRPRSRYPKQRHAFMGLLTCAQCGCAITAERKKGKYVYYHCTDHHGGCDNTYIREEQLSDLLGGAIKSIQITRELAEEIETALRMDDAAAEERRRRSLDQLEDRHMTVLSKLDRGYDDFLAGRISEEFWKRKSQEWEAEASAINDERARFEQARPLVTVTAQKILELANQAETLYKSQNSVEQRRLLETVLSNCTFDRGTLCPTYTKPFDLLVQGNKTGDWLLRLDSNQQPSG